MWQSEFVVSRSLRIIVYHFYYFIILFIFFEKSIPLHFHLLGSSLNALPFTTLAQLRWCTPA